MIEWMPVAFCARLVASSWLRVWEAGVVLHILPTNVFSTIFLGLELTFHLFRVRLNVSIGFAVTSSTFVIDIVMTRFPVTIVSFRV